MKRDGKLSRKPLKGALGDALHAVMCGAGHKIRMLLRKLRLLCAQFGLALHEVPQVISPSRRTNYIVAVQKIKLFKADSVIWLIVFIRNKELKNESNGA